MTDAAARPDLATIRRRHVRFVCSCGGRRWVKDENWQGPDYAIDRTKGDGLIPCGLCNEGGWDTPENEPDPTCDFDRQPWPCDAAALLSEIERRGDDLGAAAGLRSAVSEAIQFLNVLGDPIAAYLTLVAALGGDYPKPKPAPVAPPDPATPCTCGHRRDHHTNRDVDDVVGWPCRDCRSKRCRGFAAAPTEGSR